MTINGYALLTGTARNPALILSFTPWNPHPTKSGLTMLDWVRGLPGRTFNKETKNWEVSGVGPNPDQVMANAGFEVVYPTDNPEFTGITSLTQLYTPVTMLAANQRTVLLRHRFAGFDEAKRLAGDGAVWDKKRGLFRVPVTDVLQGGQVRPGIHWTQESINRAYQMHHLSPIHPALDEVAAILGSTVNPDDALAAIGHAQAVLGGLPPTFKRELFPYQLPGALAVAAGHTGLFDAPGVGKSLQALAAAAIRRAQRILIICPPVVLTNWMREAVLAGVAEEHEIAVFRTGRKEPSLVDRRVVVIADSLLASRPATVEKLVAWAPDYVAYDEAHRSKTMGSKRGEAILDLVAGIPGTHRVAITGTPMFASPHELIPLLEFTGHLGPVFGGAGAFLARYCRQDFHGGWHAQMGNLAELRTILARHVWVRRTKAEVLPFLPKASLYAKVMDVELTLYKKAHNEVIEKIYDWLDAYHQEHGRKPERQHVGADGELVDEIAEYAKESIRFVSQLRQAAGLTKIAAAAEIIQDHVEATTIVHANGTREYTRPLIVWTHHQVVTEAMAAAIPDTLGETGVISGGTSDKEKNRLVDALQAGQIPVLVCSITAAGVGITLTRSSDVLFVETDWTPALIGQAIDRVNRIGQKNAITVNTLVAVGTLDEHIQSVLETKGEILAIAMGDRSADVAVIRDAEDHATPSKIVEELIVQALKTWKPGRVKS